MNVSPTTITAPVSPRARWQMLSGDRFYIAARWVILALLALIGSLLARQPLWPPTLAMDPILLLVWMYALFNLLASLALFVPALGVVLNLAFLIDIVFISLFTYFSQDQRDLFYPLYLLPLVSAAFRLRPATSMLTGFVAAGAYIAAYLLARVGPNNGTPPHDTLSLVGLLLRAAALVGIPWLTSGLAERWTTTNRLSVALAEQKQQSALTEANAYRDQMRSLYDVAYTLSTTLNYQSVLDAALSESRKLVPYTCGLVLLSTGSPDELYIAAAAGLSEADKQRRG